MLLEPWLALVVAGPVLAVFGREGAVCRKVRRRRERERKGARRRSFTWAVDDSVRHLLVLCLFVFVLFVFVFVLFVFVNARELEFLNGPHAPL